MKFDTLLILAEEKDYKVMLSHKNHSTQSFWARWDAKDQVWRIKMDTKTLELPDLKDIGNYGFSFVGSSGSYSKGEGMTVPKEIVKAGRALEDK